MPAGNIRISPDTMRGRAGEFRNEASKIGDVISTMDRLLSQLQSEWEGSASDAYANRYQSELRPDFKAAQDLANEIAQSLDRTATILEETDRNIASGFAG